METFSALLAICVGISPVTGEFPSQRPMTRSFDVFFDLRLNKLCSKLSRRRWFESPLCSLWRHCNVSSHFLWRSGTYRFPRRDLKIRYMAARAIRHTLQQKCWILTQRCPFVFDRKWVWSRSWVTTTARCFRPASRAVSTCPSASATNKANMAKNTASSTCQSLRPCSRPVAPVPGPVCTRRAAR